MNLSAKQMNPASNQSGNARMDTVLKMLLIAFIALLAFSSGVYFGKQLSDSDYQLKALESDFNNSRSGKVAENESGTDDSINREEATALTETLAEKLVSGEKAELAQKHGEEERKVASEDGHHEAPHKEPAQAAPAHAATTAATKPAHSAAPAQAHSTAPAKKSNGHDAHDGAHAAPAHAPAAASHTAPAGGHGAAPAKAQAAQSHSTHPQSSHSATAQKPDLTAATKAAQRVASNAAPTELPKANEHRVPTSLPKTVGLSQDVEFTVQVASFPTAEIAKEHADALVKKGFPAFPVEATVNGKVWYRVSVGSFKTQKEATAYRAQLLKQANVSTAIVQKITR